MKRTKASMGMSSDPACGTCMQARTISKAHKSINLRRTGGLTGGIPVDRFYRTDRELMHSVINDLIQQYVKNARLHQIGSFRVSVYSIHVHLSNSDHLMAAVRSVGPIEQILDRSARYIFKRIIKLGDLVHECFTFVAWKSPDH